jgi:YHS domain-containing protein
MESLLSILLFVVFFYLMMRYGCGRHLHGAGCGHSSHAHRKTESQNVTEDTTASRQTSRDPVCGTEIEINRAPHSTKHAGATYYFCSKACYWRFQQSPEYFAEIERMEKRYIA